MKGRRVSDRKASEIDFWSVRQLLWGLSKNHKSQDYDYHVWQRMEKPHLNSYTWQSCLSYFLCIFFRANAMKSIGSKFNKHCMKILRHCAHVNCFLRSIPVAARYCGGDTQFMCHCTGRLKILMQVRRRSKWRPWKHRVLWIECSHAT